jgi:hypothetical protein
MISTVEKYFKAFSDAGSDIINFHPEATYNLKISVGTIKYLGKKAILYKSQKVNKKYAIIDPSGKTTHFGQLGYEDFTKHNDKSRKENYLTRTAGMKGNWKNNPYSANNLSRNILW